tara:strand:- start:227 stop:436 length:210 start_codon:yes stop_codon:yes gene_type:complete
MLLWFYDLLAVWLPLRLCYPFFLMRNKPSYGWKDFITDAAIILIVLGIVFLIVGSSPEFFSKFLPFLNK